MNVSDAYKGTLRIRSAKSADYGQMYTLQRAAYVDEAMLYGTPYVPALNESFSDFLRMVFKVESWVAIDKNRIVGSVSLRQCRELPDVERLMVAPDRRGEGISSRLLKEVERVAYEAGHRTLHLIVGDLAIGNQQMYEHLGWQRSGTFFSPEYEQVLLHNMTKTLIAPGER